MYVEKLSILNLRGYSRTDINFSKGINVIVGANNSGKSTILKCLYDLQENNIGINEDDIRKGYLSCKTYIELEDIQDNDKSLFKQNKAKLPFTIGSKQGVLFHIGKTPAGTPIREHLVFEEGKGVAIFSNEDIRINGMSGNQTAETFEFSRFSSMEDERNFIYPFFSRRKTDNFHAQAGRQGGFGIDHTLRTLPGRISKLSNGSYPYSKAFKRDCEDILGIDIGNLPGKDSSDGLGIFVNSRDRIFIESMGDGVANILGLLAILHTEDRKLFVIEELENDIHPAALKKLLNVIVEKSKSNQFIITTHSNIVLKHLAAISETKILFTEFEFYNKNGVHLPKNTIKEIDNTSEERFRILNELGYDLLDFDLYKAYIFFEESSAEQIVKEFLIPEFVPELKDKIKTIAAKGVNNLEAQLSDFLRLFVFVHVNSPIYHHKAWIIADGDPAGLEVIKRMRGKFSSWPTEHFINFQQADFECYYPERFQSEYGLIKVETDKAKKREMKHKLTKSVIRWIREDRDKAVSEFKNSASQAIEILKVINKQI